MHTVLKVESRLGRWPQTSVVSPPMGPHPQKSTNSARKGDWRGSLELGTVLCRDCNWALRFPSHLARTPLSPPFAPSLHLPPPTPSKWTGPNFLFLRSGEPPGPLHPLSSRLSWDQVGGYWPGRNHQAKWLLQYHTIHA